jgi:hypothetical protein
MIALAMTGRAMIGPVMNGPVRNAHVTTARVLSVLVMIGPVKTARAKSAPAKIARVRKTVHANSAAARPNLRLSCRLSSPAHLPLPLWLNRLQPLLPTQANPPAHRAPASRRLPNRQTPRLRLPKRLNDSCG